MTTQPEALRLAELWEKHSHGYALTPEAMTAAELRRLHAENEALRAALAAVRFQCAAELRRLSAVEAQRDALLDACKGLLNLFEQHEDRARIKSPVGDYARAAIKKAEEA